MQQPGYKRLLRTFRSSDSEGPKPPKTLLPAIKQLKRRSDTVITKPDKGSGVVVMDKSQYIGLLSEASVNDTNKFRAVPLEKPKSKGRPPKQGPQSRLGRQNNSNEN